MALETVAAVIAIGQAVAAGRHAVEILRDIPEIERDWTGLRNDVRTLTSSYKPVTLGTTTSQDDC